MMFKSLLKALCLLPVVASADTFYVEQARQGTTASAAVERLVKNELTTKGHTVVANAENSQWSLTADTIKLGNTYIVTLTKSQDSKLVYSDKLKSTSLDDLDVVAARLVTGALNDVSAANSITVDTVTENESIGTTVKTRVTRQTYLGFGPTKVANLDTNNTGENFAAGALWGVDDQFSLRAGFNLNNVSDSPADMTGVSIGGHYYLDKKKHALYAVGLAGYRWAESHDPVANSSFLREGQSESGWGVEAGIGTHFYRTASANIAAELTYNQALFEVTDGAPGSLGAKLMVFW